MIAADLGVIDYETALKYQYEIHLKRVESRIDDTIFLLEHPPVLTMGKSGGRHDLLVPEKDLETKGVPLYQLNRGGKITCHYPGQLVVYFILGIDKYDNNVHEMVANLEEAIILTISDFGVKGERIPANRGIFVGNNKIAAIGIEISHGVTMHGIALNVLEDTSLYNLFVPCGLTDKGVAFLQKCSPPGTSIEMKDIKKSFLNHFSDIFHEQVDNVLDRRVFEKRHILSETKKLYMAGCA
ncbi:MAG: lipoyl(octanoyl) transferase LipB [Deltaproteobacteria bacterium]|nr:lipoyl(octanoyl) transferase LipB [Deltaproteobacteria bacterium]